MLKNYKSCFSCSQKHIKCLGGSPCENCQKKGIKCQYIQKMVNTEVVISKSQPSSTFESGTNIYLQKFFKRRFQTNPRTSMVGDILSLQNISDRKVPIPKLMLMYMAIALE
jgi:hypothetical protein